MTRRHWTQSRTSRLLKVSSCRCPRVAHDADGDTLSYSATGLPPALTINAATGIIAGKVSYTAADGSPWSVTVTVSDGKGDTAVRTFSWAISDVPTPRFALSTIGGAHGAQIVMPLTYADATAFEGLRFTVIYDPAIVTPLHVLPAGEGAGWSVAANLEVSGIFTICDGQHHTPQRWWNSGQHHLQPQWRARRDHAADAEQTGRPMLCPCLPTG